MVGAQEPAVGQNAVHPVDPNVQAGACWQQWPAPEIILRLAVGAQGRVAWVKLHLRHIGALSADDPPERSCMQ